MLAEPSVSCHAETHADGRDAHELRWHAWQQRGLERDARRRQYLLTVASLIALTLAGWLSVFGPA